MLRTLLPLGAIAAIAVAGCASQTTSNDSSGKFRGEQRLVANTIEDFESAASKGDQDQICRDLLARPLAVRWAGRRTPTSVTSGGRPAARSSTT